MPEKTKKPKRSRLSLVVFAAMVIVLCIAYISAKKSDLENKQKLYQAAENQERAEMREETVKRTVEEEEAIIFGRREHAAHASWTSYKITAESVRDGALALERVELKRAALLESLLDDDEGKFVAEDLVELRTFRGMVDHLKVAIGEINAWKEIARSRLENAEEMLALEHHVTPANEESVSEMVTITLKQAEMMVDMRACIVYFEELLEKGKQKQVDGPPLRVAIEKKNAADLAEITRERQEEIERIELEEEEKLREQLRQQAREKIVQQRELAKEEHEAEMLKLKQETESLQASNQQQMADQQRLEEEAKTDQAMRSDLRRIQSLLKPFISKARNQFDANYQPVLTQDDVPVSLSTLEQMGALKQSTKGLGKLRNAAHVAHDGGRPLGSFPIDIFAGDALWQEAQDLLIKHGDAMVRAGLLTE